MKKALLLLLLFSCITLGAQTFPVQKPNLGNPSLVICHQNAHNYFVVDLTNRSDYHDVAGLETLTQKLVQSLRYIDADIYAICELEVNDSALAYLNKAMNTAAGSQIYNYIHNNMTGDNTVIMSGFIYRTDRVRPIGSSSAASTQEYYKRTMRIQTWEQLSNGERFVLSENHFKAKDNTDDAGQAKRNRNASDLISALSRISSDPDILITGDLNETTTEPAVTSIINAGYAEQLERFGNNPYSYYYGGQNQLIDHALANTSMAAQITGAGVFHINTATRSSMRNTYWYSDHDPILIGLRLGEDVPTTTTCANDQQTFTDGFGNFAQVTSEGDASWTINSTYGACITTRNSTHTNDFLAWLVSPEYDLTGAVDATITLNHNIYYNNAGDSLYQQYQTLWGTNAYTGDPATTQWTQIPITSYAVKKYVTAACPVPETLYDSTFRYALRYEAPTAATGNYWEVKSAKLTATCSEVATAIDPIPAENKATKFFYDGQLYIKRGASIYNIQGIKIN